MNRFVILSIAIYFGCSSLAPLSAQQPKPKRPNDVLTAYANAVKAGDIAAVADMTAEPHGANFRRLAAAVVKAKTASEQLNEVLRKKDSDSEKKLFADAVNLFGSFNPINGQEFILVEPPMKTKKTGELLARAKFGPSGRSQELPIVLKQENGVWRVGLPGKLAKQIEFLVDNPGITEKEDEKKTLLDNRVEGLNRLADLLDSVRQEVEANKLKDSKQVVFKIISGFAEKKIGQLLK